jgi:DNA-binding response OmpR family regulator
MRILVVEDDERIADSVRMGLEMEGYAVDVEHDGENGFLSATAEDYDLIVTDIMMPVMDGFAMIRKLREAGVKTPIIALTAKTQNQDVVSGLDSGADDYLAKPFSFEVLLARIRALLRRPSETQDVVLSVADLQIDPASRTVLRDGHDISLSSKEFALLEYLVRSQGKVVSKDQLIAHVWDFDADILPNTVEVFIKFIRDKVEKPFPKSPKLIHTVRGLGYKVEVK